MIFANPRAAEVRFVIDNLSARSREDVFGATEMQPAAFADFLTSAPGFKWCIYHEGRPAALIGAMPLHRRLWSLFGMGTDDWIKVWRLVTLVARRDMMRAVAEAGAWRAECLSPASHVETHRWLRALGASHEVAMPQYGKDGEDYTLFAWLKERGDVRRQTHG